MRVASDVGCDGTRCSTGVTGAAGTSCPPARPVLGLLGSACRAGEGPGKHCCMGLDSAGRTSSDLHTGSLFLLCKTSRPAPVVFYLWRRKFAVARSCGFVGVWLGCSSSSRDWCVPREGSSAGCPWAGSAPAPPVMSSSGVPPARASLRCCWGAHRELSRAPQMQGWCVPAPHPSWHGLHGGVLGHVLGSGSQSPGNCRKPGGVWVGAASSGRGCSPPPMDSCLLLRDLHFQFTMAISRWNITRQTLCHRGDCAKSINSTGAGVNPDNVIFYQSRETEKLLGSVNVLMQPHLSKKGKGDAGDRQSTGIFSVY